MNEVKTTTTTTVPSTEHPVVDQLRALELKVLTSYTLADAIREGSGVTTQKVGGWVEGDSACALGAGYLAARARRYV